MCLSDLKVLGSLRSPLGNQKFQNKVTAATFLSPLWLDLNLDQKLIFASREVEWKLTLKLDNWTQITKNVHIKHWALVFVCDPHQSVLARSKCGEEKPGPGERSGWPVLHAFLRPLERWVNLFYILKTLSVTRNLRPDTRTQWPGGRQIYEE